MARKSLKKIIVDAIEDGKGNDIVVLDVRKVSDVADTLVIASGTSTRHVKSLAERAVLAAKENGYRPLGVEDSGPAEWVLADFGDVVLHVMLPATREFYDLEKLWSTPPVAGDGAEKITMPRPGKPEVRATRPAKSKTVTAAKKTPRKPGASKQGATRRSPGKS